MELQIGNNGNCSRLQGHHQHDTQEFTMFLLDGLHDDLNRAKKEQSLPNREYGPEKPHKDVADATWRKYKSDNDSIEVSISECLRNFTEPEQIERSCQCDLSCVKRLSIFGDSRGIHSHLCSLFSYSFQSQTHFRYWDFNLGDAIANSEEKHQLYELISATFHIGKITDGHYMAMVPMVNLREASSDDVYMLYYQKIASPLSRHTGSEE
uniref:ubiquitinyl hydrolase 1 n=1 Tax=Ditylenchus dipsaci TaxID=166011 RepID=A0A915E0Q2_9BILA